MRWQKKLNKKEMQHLKDTQEGCPTLAGLKRNRAYQKQEREKHGISYDCMDCKRIAIKLGIEKWDNGNDK